MRNLERAIRLFRALVETGSDVQVTSSTLWSWPDVQSALGSKDGDYTLLTEMEALDPAVRERTLRYCGSFAPLEPKGDVYVFPNTEAADKFVSEMDNDLGAVATHLADGIVSAYGETPDAVELTASKFGGTPWNGARLEDAFESVDVDLPYTMVQDGFNPHDVEAALVEALWKDRDAAINEAFFMHAPANKANAKFRGRLAQWAVPRPVLGVNPRLFEALRMAGALPRRLCLLLEADPQAPGAVTPASPGAATSGDQGASGGTTTGPEQQPGGQPAQSQEPAAKEAPKPTEHVPTQEEGGTAMGQVKLPDGTVVPPEIMRQALGKMLHNLATQVEQGTTGGKPAEKPADQGAQQKQGEPPEVEPGQTEQPEPQAPQQPEPQQAAQQGQPPEQQAQQQESITEDLHRALGLLKSPRPRDVIAGVNLVKQTGFSGQPQSVVERVLDEFDALKGSPNARVRRAINSALETDLYRAGRTMIPVLPEGLDYGTGQVEPGTAVVIVENRGARLVLRLPTGATVLAPASAVAMVEANVKGMAKRVAAGAIKGAVAGAKKGAVAGAVGAMSKKPKAKMGEAEPKLGRGKRFATGRRRASESAGDDVIRGQGALYDNPNPLAPKRAVLGETRDWGGDILKAAARHRGKIAPHWQERIQKNVALKDYDEAVNILVGAFGLNDLPSDVKEILHAWESANESITEQLDVGQEDEKIAAGKGFATTAAKLKQCRSHTFDLVTKDLVQLESLAQAVGAKRTLKLLNQTRDKATDFLDALKATAELLDKANETFKGEGGKGGDTVDQEQAAAVAGVAPAVAPAAVVPAAPAAAPAVGEAIRRVSKTSIPRRIAAGESYEESVESIHSVASDLGLSKQQLAEVYDKINSLALHDDGTPEFSVEFSRTDHRLLESVQRHGGLVRGLVQRTANGRETFATRTELREAAVTLRRHGKVEHGMLADDLEAIVTKAC